jgi:hypothetical protein
MKLIKRQALLAKQEATQGTPVVPSASTDALRVLGNIDITVEKELLVRDFRRASLDKLASVVGTRFFKVKFSTELIGSGTVGDATIPGYKAIDALIQACAFTSTSVASTSITYAPVSSAASGSYYGPGKSVTLECYKDGLKYIVAGALGTCKKRIIAGQFGFLDFEFWGMYSAPTDVSVPTVTITAPVPAVFQSATISVQGFAAILREIEIDVANAVSMRLDAASANAVKGFVITDRDPKGMVKVEGESVAVHDFYGKLISGAEASSSFVLGATAGNIITCTYPKSQYTSVDHEEADNFLLFGIPMKFNGNSGDDWEGWVVT